MKTTHLILIVASSLLAACTPFNKSTPSAVVEHLRSMNVVNGPGPDGALSSPRSRANDQSTAFWGGAQP